MPIFICWKVIKKDSDPLTSHENKNQPCIKNTKVFKIDPF